MGWGSWFLGPCTMIRSGVEWTLLGFIFRELFFLYLFNCQLFNTLMIMILMFVILFFCHFQKYQFCQNVSHANKHRIYILYTNIILYCTPDEWAVRDNREISHCILCMDMLKPVSTSCLNKFLLAHADKSNTCLNSHTKINII